MVTTASVTGARGTSSSRTSRLNQVVLHAAIGGRPDAYELFQRKQEGTIKLLLEP
jgi:hypothetical protein